MKNLLLFIIFFSSAAIAQEYIAPKPLSILENEKGIKDDFSKTIFKSLPVDQSILSVVQPIKSWNLTTNINPALNFSYFTIPLELGDINGDKKMDYYIPSEAMNEQSKDILSDKTFKTAVFYGGNYSITPDTLFYKFLIAAGDLNNDGFDDVLSRSIFSEPFEEHAPFEIYLGSSDGLIETGVFISGTEDYETFRTPVAFVDIDGDGIQDVFLGVTGVWNAAVIFGNNSVNEIIYETNYFFEIPNANTSIGNLSYTVGDLERDGRDEVIFLKGGYDDNVLGVYEFGRNSSFNRQLIFDLPLESLVQNFLLVDIDADSLNELYLGDRRGLYLKTNSSGIIEETPYIIQKSDINPIPVGDLNNDKRVDFISRSDQENTSLFISFGPENLEDGLSLDIPITDYFQDSSWVWSWTRVSDNSKNRFFSDYNGDGIDDVILRHSENGGEKTGIRIILGSETNDFESVFLLEDLEKINQIIFEVAGNSDLNNDGIPDFTIAKYLAKELHVFFGGTDISEEADLVIELDYRPQKIITGDFNGDSFSDLLVGDNTGVRANMYFGGDNFSSEHDLQILKENLPEVYKEGQGLYSPENVGDYNGDGIDDLIFIDQSRVYIYLGGSTFYSPDFVIDLESKYGALSLSYSASGLGDIDNDGKNDFAIGSPNFINENGTIGAVFLFGGESEGEHKIRKIFQSDSLSKLYNFGASISGGADINEDGFPDLVITSESIGDASFSDKMISIYYGGDIFDEITDKSLGIPNKFTQIDLERYNSDYSFRIQGEVSYIDWVGEGNYDLLMIPNNVVHPIIYSEDYIIQLYAPNTSTFLGNHSFFDNSAIGDFNDDGNIEIIIPQVRDNNDAVYSSRVYMYSFDKSLVNTEATDNFIGFELGQNYPNPFNPVTQISFRLPMTTNVKLSVFNLLGQKVADIVDAKLSIGSYNYKFNASHLSSGVYFYRLEAGGRVETKKMTLIK